jgi:hypothetical protein
LAHRSLSFHFLPSDVLLLLLCAIFVGSRDNSAGIVTSVWAGRPRIPGSIPVKRCFWSPLRPVLGLLFSVYWGLFPPGVKRPGREADHSLVSSAEVKNAGAIALLPLHLHGVVDNLYLAV